jgi:hypothetical protein
MKTLVFIIGPPAVGKMTVGAALRDLTGLPLFHNHQSIEAVLPVFGFGTPQFGTLVGEFRRRVFEEVANSDLPGLIFTFVWAVDVPADMSFVEELKAIFESRGGRTVFVELWADLETRLGRNASELRLEAVEAERGTVAVEAARARGAVSLQLGRRLPLRSAPADRQLGSPTVGCRRRDREPLRSAARPPC